MYESLDRKFDKKRLMLTGTPDHFRKCGVANKISPQTVEQFRFSIENKSLQQTSYLLGISAFSEFFVPRFSNLFPFRTHEELRNTFLEYDNRVDNTSK